jgi:hypothetical protein
MVVHIGSNPLILKHKKVVQRWARIKHPWMIYNHRT